MAGYSKETLEKVKLRSEILLNEIQIYEKMSNYVGMSNGTFNETMKNLLDEYVEDVDDMFND
jgi:hypothetical protein